MVSKEFLESIEDTYSDDEYVNVVGDASDLVHFLNKCLQKGIWYYKVYTVCVYLGEHIKGVFLKKEDIQAIKQLIADKKLVLNASNPFF